MTLLIRIYVILVRNYSIRVIVNLLIRIETINKNRNC